MYVVEPVGEDITASIEALPPELLADVTELRGALEVSPWTVGTPLVPSNPAGLRIATIGPDSTGQVVYHVMECDRSRSVLTRQPDGAQAWKIVIPTSKVHPEPRTHDGHEWFGSFNPA